MHFLAILMIPVLATMCLAGCGINAQSMHGTVHAENRVYTNKPFGYELTLPETWTVAGAEELAAFNASASGEGTAQAEQAGNYYADFIASDTAAGSSIVIRNIQIGPRTFIGSEEELYVSLAESLKNDAAAAGIENAENADTDVTFLGQPQKALGVVGDFKLAEGYSTKMRQALIPCRNGVYVSLIYINCVSDDSGEALQGVLDLFRAVS